MKKLTYLLHEKLKKKNSEKYLPAYKKISFTYHVVLQLRSKNSAEKNKSYLVLKNC